MSNYHRPSSVKLIAVLVPIMLLHSACNIPVGELFSPYKCASAQSNKSDINGTWVPDEATFKDMGERGEYDTSVPIKLILGKDGSFEMVNMPDWVWELGSKSHKGFRSESGEWQLSSEGGCGMVDLRYGGSYSRLELLQRKSAHEPAYFIRIILGDPDSGEKMIFVKNG